MEGFGILSLLPPVIAIILALKTKDVIVSLISSVAVGALILAHFNPHGAFVVLWQDLYFAELSKSWNAELLILITIIGGFVEIMERSGGAQAFGNYASRVVKNRLTAQLATWVGGLLIFFSDSANSLIMGPIFRPIYDGKKVSREKLAYILDSTSSPICVVLPITTWVAVIAGIMQNEFTRVGVTEDAFLAYGSVLPYLLYPILALLLVPIVALSGREFGAMARAEHRAIHTGQTWSDRSAHLNTKADENFELKNAKASVAGIPLVVLFGLIVLMFISFGFPGSDLEGYQTRMSLGTAYSVATLVCLFMAVRNKIMTFSQGISVVMEGMQKMTYMSVVLLSSFCLGSVCGQLGAAAFIAEVTQSILIPGLLPFLMFVIACVISFATGTATGTFGILLPIAIPMSLQVDINMYLCIAAVVSGALFGDHCSPISDTTMLCSAASGCDNIDHVITQTPYALIAASASAVGFLIAPILGNSILPLIIAGAVMAASFWTACKTKGEKIQEQIDHQSAD